jgi:multidrug efflux system membrane fusion protein
MDDSVTRQADTQRAPDPGPEAFQPRAVPDGAPGQVRDAPRARKTRSPWRPLLLLLLVAAIGYGLWRMFSPTPAAHRGTGGDVQRVGAAKVSVGDIKQEFSALGTVTPMATITVQTQINGQLQSVGFKEGQMVRKGDFLAQIDPRPYQAALDQAEGTLAHDQGLLAQAESDLERYEKLGKQDSIALQQVTDARFLVQQDKGTVALDEATIENAKLNLVYCHIVAPVTGRVGLRLVDPGNYVQTTSSTGLVVLTQLQPISVIFVLPEDQIPDVWGQIKDGKTLTVTAFNRANAKPIAAGTVNIVDNEIDTTTGTVKLRAIFPNEDETLFPNQFVNAHLLERTLPKATIAPVAAIQHGAPGAYVYLVKPDGTVSVQKVETGVVDGDNVQITSGLKEGDTVVVDGADRLRDGVKVEVVGDSSDPAAGGDAGAGGHRRKTDAPAAAPTPAKP